MTAAQLVWPRQASEYGMRRTTKIAVIGAGLGGMTVAGLLQRRG